MLHSRLLAGDNRENAVHSFLFCDIKPCERNFRISEIERELTLLMTEFNLINDAGTKILNYRRRRGCRYALIALKFADESNPARRMTKRREDCGGGRRIDRRRRLLLVSTLVSMAILRWPPRSVAAPASSVIGFLVMIKVLSRGISLRPPRQPPPLRGTPTTSSETRMRSKIPILQFFVSDLVYWLLSIFYISKDKRFFTRAIKLLIKQK